MQYAQRIKELRKDKKLTQKEIANILNITQATYSDMENGKSAVTKEHTITLAKYYNISADYLLCLTDEKRKLR